MLGNMLVGRLSQPAFFIEEPDSLCRHPSERRVRGGARGPYDRHPCTTTVRSRSAWTNIYDIKL
eukprot:3011740-Heterocapsa_arctica.AAC.1